MNAWQRFLFFLTGKAVGTKVLPWQKNQPQFLQENYLDMAEGGYRKNELVYACINEIARSVPEAPLRVYDPDEQELSDHPVRQLIRRPNEFMTEFELWELTLLYMYLSGNAYWEKVRSNGGRVVELFPLRPDRMQIVPDDEEFIKGYIYELGGMRFPIDKRDVIHFKFPNPLDDFLGMAPLRAALRQVSVDNEATDFAKSLLENSAIPGTVITTQSMLDDDQAERLKKKWKQKFGGRKRGEPAFLQEGMDVKTIGMNMQDLAFPDLRSISETRICSVFQVPPILVGANTGLERSTFSNYEEARKSFWQETISPLLMRLQQVIRHDLLLEFDQTNELRFDKSEVSALQGLQQERWERSDKAVNSGWIMVNEARSEVGFDRVPGGDVFLRDFNKSAVPGDASEEDLTATATPPQGQPQDGEPPNNSEPPNIPEPIEQRSKITPLKKKYASEQKQAEIQLLARAFRHIDFAEENYDKLFEFAQREFRLERQEFLRKFNREAKLIDPAALTRIFTELRILTSAWTTRIQKDVFPTMEALIRNAISEAKGAGDLVGIAFNLTNEAAVDFIKRYSFKFAQKMSDTSQKQIRETILRGQTEGLTVNEQRNELMKKFSDWNTIRATNVARSETIRASNAGAVHAYQSSGVMQYQWLAASDPCPFCESLDGTIINMGQSFLKVGDSIILEDGKKYTNNYEDVEAPPLHIRCRCTIIPIIE